MSMSDDQSAGPGGQQQYQQQPARRHGEQEPPVPPPSQPYPQPPESYVVGREPDIDLRDRSHDDLNPSTTPIPPVYAQPSPPSYAQQPVPPAPAQGTRRSKPSFPDGAARLARRHLGSPQARRLFGRSEFVLTICGAVLLILAAAIQQNFDAPQMWTLFTLLFVGYVVSRGIAKAGSDKSD